MKTNWNYCPSPRLCLTHCIHLKTTGWGGCFFLFRKEWEKKGKSLLFEKNCNLSEISALHGLSNYMLFSLMTAWREVNGTKAAGAGLWIGPHHPCKLQIRGQHMQLKTNIKIDTSCVFKQEDATELHRRKAQEPIASELFCNATVRDEEEQARGRVLTSHSTRASPHTGAATWHPQ